MSEPDVTDLLTVQEAIAIIDGVGVSPRVESVPLSNAAGRVLAEDLRADRDFPPFDKSQMDGYAVRSTDLAEVPARLRVTETIAAGASGKVELAAWQAAAIMTGAPVPPGADAVVPVEFTQSPAPDRVVIQKAVRAGASIARRASDCRAGAVVLTAGGRLGPAQLAVAASVGATTLRVFAKPRVAVLSTGDEIVDMDAIPGPTQIRNSNSPMLLSLLQSFGCETIDLAHVRDEPAVIRDAITRGLSHDALFITGGMSMGQFDYVPRLLQELNVDLKITKLKIKPGKPFVFGLAPSGACVFGLPGNPVSAFVCTLRLASRLISRMGGQAVRERWIDAPLETSLPANGPREFYQPARWSGSLVRPMNWKGSADIFTLAEADGLIIRPADDPARAAGDMVRILEVPR